jgi:hypothetical protein
MIVLTAVVWLNYSVVVGVRLVALSAIFAGGLGLYRREVSFGWRGHEPSSYVRGWPAIVLNLLPICIGLFFLFLPADIIIDISEAPPRPRYR